MFKFSDEAISQVANCNEVICLCWKDGQLMTQKIIISYLRLTFMHHSSGKYSISCYSVVEFWFYWMLNINDSLRKNIIQTQTHFIKWLMFVVLMQDFIKRKNYLLDCWNTLFSSHSAFTKLLDQLILDSSTNSRIISIITFILSSLETLIPCPTSPEQPQRM